MREIEVNKNYDNFGKSFITSRKPYQICAIVIAFILGIGIMIFLKPILGTTAASYIALVAVIPPGVIGVFERHGLDFISYDRKKRSIKQYGKLYFGRQE